MSLHDPALLKSLLINKVLGRSRRDNEQTRLLQMLLQITDRQKGPYSTFVGSGFARLDFELHSLVQVWLIMFSVFPDRNVHLG